MLLNIVVEVMEMLFVVIMVTFLFIWTLSSTVLLMVFNKEKPLLKLRYFDDDGGAAEGKVRKLGKVNVIKTLSGLVPEFKGRGKRTKRLEQQLIKADILISLEELLVIKILFATAVSFLAFSLTKGIPAIIIAFILTWNAPKLVIYRRIKERSRLFDSQLNEGIMIISNSLKAGYSFLQAVAVTSEETHDPFSKEFKKMLKEMSLGISEEEAVKNLCARVESEDLVLIVNAILIQKDVGGNLSEILDNISETIRERQKIKGELKTLTAQGRLSGIIVMLIPIFIGLAIYVFNRDYILTLFTTPVGLAMVIMSVLNQVLGFVIIRKIVNVNI